MGLMILAGAESSAALWLLLLASLGLTFWESRELQLDRQMTAWWMLLVLLVHVVGYLGMRVWGSRHKRERST